MPVNYKQKDRYEIQDLIEIMRILRTPDGCPWDRDRPTRAYGPICLRKPEAIEAINRNDMKLLCEELGDIRFKIVFHARLNRKTTGSIFMMWLTGCKKLIVRHPHVLPMLTSETAVRSRKLG